jgi:hypothetical protein
MARNSYTEVTRKGFGKRLSESISGAIIGGIMFIAAFPLLWWNEGRAIGEYRALKEGAGAVVHVAADRVDAANDGKLVHVSALVDGAPALDDTELGVTVDALALRRVVEMYQWKESRESKEKKKLGGGSETVTEYKYSTEWNDDAIDSSDFRYSGTHENPTEWPVRSDEFSAQKAMLGAFALSESARGSVGSWKKLQSSSAQQFPKAFGQFRQVGESTLYLGGDPDKPEVGDIRIRFEYQPEEVFSIVARQAGAELAEYVASNGRTVLLAESGEVPAATMFEGAQRRNTIFTWVLRGIGTLAMWFGLSMVFAPITRVLDILPMLGTIGSWGIGLVTGLISLLLSLLTIGLAWVFYRPLLGGTIIALVIALFIWSRSGKSAAVESVGPPGPPPPPQPPPPSAAPL